MADGTDGRGERDGAARQAGADPAGRERAGGISGVNGGGDGRPAGAARGAASGGDGSPGDAPPPAATGGGHLAPQVQPGTGRPLPGQRPRAGEGTVPTFLAITFVLLPLWAVWYFLTHLAPFLAIQPAAFEREAPAAVRSYRVAQATPASPRAAALASGAALYVQRCALCHGADGAGPPPGPYAPAAALRGDPLVRAMSLPALEALVSAGLPGDMPAWGSELNAQQIHNVALFVQQTLAPLPAAPGATGPTGAVAPPPQLGAG